MHRELWHGMREPAERGEVNRGMPPDGKSRLPRRAVPVRLASPRYRIG